MYRILFLATVGVLTTTACYPPTSDTDELTDTGGTVDTEPAFEVPWIGNQPDYEHYGTVTGRIVAPNGSIPAIGATAGFQVDGEDVWMLTEGNGDFALKLPPGNHDLSVLKGHFVAHQTVTIGEGLTSDLGDIHLDTSGVRLAVITGVYDDIGSMVSDLGIPYDTFSRPEDILGNAELLDQYHVVFANCGSVATTTSQNQYTTLQFSNTRDWISRGGTLYTSDWEYELFEGVVPEALNFSNSPKDGPVAQLNANVIDREIQMLLGGANADIYFDLAGWSTVESAGAAMVLVDAKIPGRTGRSPLAARMPLGDGKAIFTTFHNEEQLTEDMAGILYEMILSL